jgi:hypothetical protein
MQVRTWHIWRPASALVEADSSGSPSGGRQRQRRFWRPVVAAAHLEASNGSCASGGRQRQRRAELRRRTGLVHRSDRGARAEGDLRLGGGDRSLGAADSRRTRMVDSNRPESKINLGRRHRGMPRLRSGLLGPVWTSGAARDKFVHVKITF